MKNEKHEAKVVVEVTINVAGTKLKMTKDEAIKLLNSLKEAVGERVSVVKEKGYEPHYWPYVPWRFEYQIDTGTNRPTWGTEILCNAEVVT